VSAMTTCEMCQTRPAKYRVAAPTGPQVTEDAQIMSCVHCMAKAAGAVRDNEFVIGPAYVDPL
jgi:hypothetical protein